MPANIEITKVAKKEMNCFLYYSIPFIGTTLYLINFAIKKKAF